MKEFPTWIICALLVTAPSSPILPANAEPASQSEAQSSAATEPTAVQRQAPAHRSKQKKKAPLSGIVTSSGGNLKATQGGNAPQLKASIQKQGAGADLQKQLAKEQNKNEGLLNVNEPELGNQTPNSQRLNERNGNNNQSGVNESGGVNEPDGDNNQVGSKN